MKYAILNGQKVFKVQNTESEITIGCPDNVEPGWLYVDGDFVAPPGTLEFARKKKLAEINTTRTNKLDQPVSFGGYLWSASPVAVLNLTQVMGLINSGETVPAKFTWRTIDNQNVPATAANLIALNKAIFTHTYTVYKQSWNLKDQVLAATTVAEIEAIVWN